MAWGEIKKTIDKSGLSKNPAHSCPHCNLPLRAQNEVDEQIWENIDNALACLISIGTVETAGSSFRLTRYICRKCKRQFVCLGIGKPKETFFSKYISIR